MSASRRTLDRLGVDRDLVAKLESRGCRTAEDALNRSPLDVVELADCSHARARRFLTAVARSVAPTPITALDALKRSKWLRTTLPELDDALGGGLSVGGVTEVVGAAGAGKTQLCLSACASAAAPIGAHGSDGGVVYVDAERKFSSTRLAEIARGKFGSDFASDEAVNALARRVQIVTPTSLTDLAKRLEALEEAIIDHKVRLVIIDSVAHLARGEFGGREKVVQRQSVLGAIASTLKRHAEKHELAVLAVNQVTTRLGNAVKHAANGEDGGGVVEDDGGGGDLESTGITAALGTKWAHCVNTRLVLDVADSGERTMKIVKSPICALTAFRYYVDGRGLNISEKLDSSAMRESEANVHARVR